MVQVWYIQCMASISRANSSVYVPSPINRFIFGHGVLIYFINNATIVEENKQKTTLFTPMQGDSLSTILFILTTNTGITEGSTSIAAMTAFHCKIIFLSSVCLLM